MTLTWHAWYKHVALNKIISGVVDLVVFWYIGITTHVTEINY